MLRTSARMQRSMLGEEDQMPPDNMTGGVDVEFLADLSYEEEQPQDYSNEYFDAQQGAYYPDKPSQPNQSMDDFIPGSPEHTSTSYTQDLFSDTGPIDCNQDFLGITGGSDVSTIPTQAIRSTSSQSYQPDNPSAMNRYHQGWGTNDHTQPLNGFVQHNTQPTVNVSDYDAGQGTVHERYAAERWWYDTTVNTTTEFEAVGATDQTRTFNMQPVPDRSSSLATAHDDSCYRPHQMNTTTTDPSTLAGFDNVIQAPRRTSDEPWSHVPAAGGPFGYGNSTANYHGVRSGEWPVSESSFTYSSASNLMNTVTPDTSVQPNWQGIVDSVPTLRPPFYRNHRSRMSRPTSRGSMSAYSRSEFNGEPTRPGVQYGRHIPPGTNRSRSSSNRLSIPGDSNPTFAPPSPAPSNMSITSSNAAEVLQCEIPWCNTTFTGGYRRGNRQRHMRMKHGQIQGQEEREYPCEAKGCLKSYKRQDARLKHYRRRHPYLAPGPALSRKQFSSM